MGEIIRDWLRTRLGVMIDLSPELFGHYARDGTLLGKVLHSYDVINDSQLSTLTGTQDPALARVNLKNLRAWLRLIGVDCDNDCIEDISKGKGTMALRLFYKVFLCLENKDRLHFVTLRKEREKYIPSWSKFDVTRVPEQEPEGEQSSIQLYADTLMKSTSLIDWQRKRYVELMDGYRRNRDKFRSLQQDKEILEEGSLVAGKETEGGRRRARPSLSSAETRQLDEFSRKHRVKEEAADEACEKTGKQRKSKTPRPDREAARAYTESLKSKRRQEAMTKNFKSRMEKNLLSELWNKVLVDQEQEFDEIIAKKVLHQSQYEKQLVRKLCEVRNEKTRMAGNRRIVERLLEDTREDEARFEQERAREVTIREREEVEAEARRIEELVRKIEQQSRERRSEKKRRYVERTVLDLIDIATRAAEYKAASYEDRVPESQWNQWKALFLKNQPIVETYEREIVPDETKGEPAREQEDEDEARTEVLNEEDFDNYNCAKMPWKNFIPEVDEQVGRYLNLGLLVLGYIVHKTLDKSPRQQTEPVEPPLPAMRTRAVVLGVPDPLLYEPIRQLLKAKKIHLVRLEDAINHCLERYKAEMQDHEYIDLDIVAATRQTLAPSSTASDESERRRETRVNKSGPTRQRTVSLRKIEAGARSSGGGGGGGNGSDRDRLDKVTQTPRVIPHEDMDPRLSNAAFTGKWIYDFFSLGEPLSDDLVSRTILEYIRGLDQIEGFLIVNYPNTRRQMSSLEFALSGQRLPKDRVELSNSGIDEIDWITSRIQFEEEDGTDSWRESRLVPNPIRSCYRTGRTFFTSFVRIKPRLRNTGERMNENEEEEAEEEEGEADDDGDIWEIIREDASSVDAFYVDQEIASVLYYTIFDVETLKRLARLVIAGADDPLARVSSRELFGEYLNYFEGRREEEISASKAPLVKRLLRRSISDETRSYTSIESRQQFGDFYQVGESREPLPGEAEWSWADYFQPPELLRNLGDLWRNLETRYVETVKEALHLKRMSFDEIAPYKDFVTRHMREYIERPDKRQDLLHDFHRAFNDIPEDIRDDRTVKEELHCRIEDFQMKLWDICDSRRREAENERRRIIEEHWTSRQAANLADIYVDIVQAELERCYDSLQFLQDYYASMLQRPFQDIRSEVRLKKIQGSESKSKVTTSLHPPLKTLRGPSPSDANLVEQEIGKLLLADYENVATAESTLCWRSLEVNIQHVRSTLESLASRLLDNLKREESVAVESPFESRPNKNASFGRVSTSSNVDEEGEKARLRRLFNEWRCALMFEINRIRMRFKVLESAARDDLDHLIESMRQAFSESLKCLSDRYEREVRSLKDVTLVFRLATEQGKPIQEETLLDGDRFFVRSNVLMFPDDGEDAATNRLLVREELLLPTRFTISQLSRLACTFGSVAPGGYLSERSFVYILQDLILCDEDRYANAAAAAAAALPSSWYELGACDVTRLANELFGQVDFVDWREFLVYAMDLEAPSVAQLLSDFRAFRRIDPEPREYVTREDFLASKLWFEDCSSVDDDPKPEPDTLTRLQLLKELLCRMFSYDDQRVNYVALLLAFCKDDQPEIGLGKALSLAIDNQVCTDWKEGEEYLRAILEGTAKSESLTAIRQEALEVCESIFKILLGRVVQSSQARLEHSLATVTSLLAVTNRDENLATSRNEIQDSDAAEYSDNSVPTNDVTSSLSQESLTAGFDGKERRGRRGYSVSASLPGGENKSEGYSRCEGRVYWLNIQVPQTVLAAMLPDHAAHPNIIESGKSLRENLELISQEIQVHGISDDDQAEPVVPAHRFLRHKFVKKLLADTSKFTMKRLGNIVGAIICDNSVTRHAQTIVNIG